MILKLHRDNLAICRLHPDSPYPDWLPNRGFSSVTRTTDELSIVCNQDHLPARQTAEIDWRALEIEGPLAFTAVGILAELSGLLAIAEISIFVVSTHDTDFVLIKKQQIQRALAVLRNAGHKITNDGGADQ